jgi:hypothetical protein
MFGMTAAFATRGFRGHEALAGHCAIVSGGDCGCDPAYGQFCGDYDWSYCDGPACAAGCYYDETYYPGACWCSATCEYSSGQVGYYECCDCNCYGTTCACHHFVAVGFAPDEEEEGPPSPPGVPDRPDFPPGFPFD